MSHELEPLDTRSVFIPSVEIDQAKVKKILEDFSYKTCMIQAKSILYNLERQIKKNGGGRQRGEGVKLLRRIIKRLDQQIC